MTDISSTSHNNGLKRDGSPGASVTQMKNSSTTHSGSMNESITSSTSESFRDPASTSFHGSPAKNLSPKGSGGGLKVATTTTGDQLLKEDRPGWSPKVAAVTSPISPLSEDDEVHLAPQRKYTSAPGLMGYASRTTPPNGPLSVPPLGPIGNMESSDGVNNSLGISPTTSQIGGYPNTQLHQFLADFEAVRPGIVDQPCTDADAAQCINVMKVDDARRNLHTLYRLCSQLHHSVQETKKMYQPNTFSGSTSPAAGVSPQVMQLKTPGMKPTNGPPVGTPPSVGGGGLFSFVGSSPDSSLRHNGLNVSGSNSYEFVGKPGSGSSRLGSGLGSKRPPDASMTSWGNVSTGGMGNASTLVTLFRAETMSSLVGLDGSSGGTGPSQWSGPGSAGANSDPEGAGAQAMHLGNVSTSEFLRNIAAFNAKFENPMHAASVASISEAQCVAVKSTGEAKMVHGRDVVGDENTFELNQYSVLQELGRGSQGCVYLCYDNQSNEFRALKAIKRGLTASSAMEKFKQEVAIMKRLRHQNIVTLHEVIDDPKLKHIYLVMQYVEKGPLVKWIGNQHVRCEMIDSWRFQYFARQICAGLSYLHQRRIYHRDIKPENILLGMDDHVYLADFGVAHMTREQRRETISASRPVSPTNKAPTPRLEKSPQTSPDSSINAPPSSAHIPMDASHHSEEGSVPPPNLREAPDAFDSPLTGRNNPSAPHPNSPPPGQSVLESFATTDPGAAFSTDGTPAYFAPEIILGGEKLNQAAIDVWALGVTCYQLLTGRLPFDMDSPGDRKTEPRAWSQDTACPREPSESYDGSNSAPLGASTSTTAPSPYDDQLREEHLKVYPEEWWRYLRSVVEQPIPYLSDEWLQTHSRNKAEEFLGGNLSQTQHDLLDSMTSSPPHSRKNSSEGVGLESGNLLNIVKVASPKCTVWNSPVPKEWFSVLRGMLIRDPKKRWSLEQVRASIKAMGTLHKIESSVEREVTNVESLNGSGKGSSDHSLPTPKPRGPRNTVLKNRLNNMLDVEESFNLDPDSPWHSASFASTSVPLTPTQNLEPTPPNGLRRKSGTLVAAEYSPGADPLVGE